MQFNNVWIVLFGFIEFMLKCKSLLLEYRNLFSRTNTKIMAK